MLNFIAVLMCMVGAGIHGCFGNIGWIIMELILALINLPYAIQWLRRG